MIMKRLFLSISTVLLVVVGVFALSKTDVKNVETTIEKNAENAMGLPCPKCNGRGYTQICNDCEGRGGYEEYYDCRWCDGGYVTNKDGKKERCLECGGSGQKRRFIDCTNCKGVGTIKCSRCGGSGKW